MKVKLLQDITRSGKVKIVARRDRKPVAFFAGAVIEASAATAQKWIEAKLAEPYVEEK